MMKNHRYGKFRFSNYYSSYVAVLFLMTFSITSIVLDLSLLLAVFSAAYAAIWLWTILTPHCEQFTICKDSIIAYAGRKSQTIRLPRKLTLVISYADICPPFAMRTAVEKQTHILKNVYAVSILKEMPVDVVLETLHRNHVKQYTTSTIRRSFDDYLFIYSFVCSQALFDELASNRECLLVIPESLSSKVSFDSNLVKVHIDGTC